MKVREKYCNEEENKNERTIMMGKEGFFPMPWLLKETGNSVVYPRYSGAVL
jgi:hypothetical protein